ncbi:hypothetical protein CPB85DRAFT_1445925 [Mucidula mucida]|nr:hypothetical protein CPB85DRAFT_1445925 [Mucidula mucida]
MAPPPKATRKRAGVLSDVTNSIATTRPKRAVATKQVAQAAQAAIKKAAIKTSKKARKGGIPPKSKVITDQVGTSPVVSTGPKIDLRTRKELVQKDRRFRAPDMLSDEDSDNHVKESENGKSLEEDMRDCVKALLDRKKSARAQESLKEVHEEEVSDNGEDDIREDQDEEDMLEDDEEREADNKDTLKLFDDEAAHVLPRTNKTMTGATKIVDDIYDDHSMVVDFGLNDGPSDIEDVADDDDAAPTARNLSGSGIEDWLAEYPEVWRMILEEIDHVYAKSLDRSLAVPARGRRRKNPQSAGRHPQDEVPLFPANDQPRSPCPASRPAPHPVLRPAPYPSPRSLVTRQQHVNNLEEDVDSAQSMDPDNPIFLRRTQIMVVQHGQRWFLTKRDQGPAIERVLCRAIRIATCLMAINPENPDFIPFNQFQLEALCLDSLVAAATELGHGGVGDIGDRLINGDADMYVKPLRAYVQQHLIIQRSDVKKIAAAVVPGLLDLSKTDAGRRKSKDLLENLSYAFGLNAAGQQDRSKPLSAPVFVPLLSAAYGSSALVKYVDKLSSVIAEGPQSKELEVTPLMVAMTATAVHAVVSEIAHNTKEEFSGTNLENVFKTHLTMLNGLRERRIVYYHKLMHDFYISSTGALPHATHGLSTDQVLSTIDWDVIA